MGYGGSVLVNQDDDDSIVKTMPMHNSRSTNGDSSAEVSGGRLYQNDFWAGQNHSCGMSEETSPTATFCIATMEEWENVITPAFVNTQIVVRDDTTYHI